MITVLAVAAMAVAAEAMPYTFGDRLPPFNAPLNAVPTGFGPREAPLNPFPGIGDEVNRWIDAVSTARLAPSNSVQDRPGPSVYDDYSPPSPPHAEAALSNTLFFEEFPHRRAVLNWQEKRLQQGLPIYKLLSQRPGFPFYQGN